MFRRKEDSLFDTATDPNQGPIESATVINPQSQPQSAQQPTASSTSSASSSAPSSSYNPTASNPVSRPSGSSGAGSFRAPSAPIGGELSRSRLPEAKSGMSALGNQQGNAEKSKASVRRVLTVGNDILLKGEIATCDRLVIEGKVDATLNDVHTVEIAEHGSFKGSAHIEDAEISGLFEGDLVVRGRLVIYGTGKVRGKITYGEIEIERGGELSGEIKTSVGAASGQAMAPRPPRQQKDANSKDAVAA